MLLTAQKNSPKIHEVVEATETVNAAITKDKSILRPAKVGISHTKSTNEVPQNPPSPSKEQALRI